VTAILILNTILLLCVCAGVWGVVDNLRHRDSIRLTMPVHREPTGNVTPLPAIQEGFVPMDYDRTKYGWPPL